MNIFDHLKKKRESLAQQDPKRESYHSRSYHNYFEDYVEYEALNSKGKLVTVRHYKGDWYIEEGGRPAKLRRRIGLGLLGLTILGLFVTASCLPVPANRVWYGGIGQIPVFVLLVLKGFAFFSYISLEERITIGRYKGGYERVRTYALLAAFAFALSLLLQLICLAILREEVPLSLLSAGLTALGGGLSFLQNRLLLRVPFTVIDNEDPTPKGAVQIKKREKLDFKPKF